MSLPTTIILPLRADYGNDEDIDRYLRDLVFELQSMYENMTDNINGFIRNNADVDQSQWQPTLNGTVPGTFTYLLQVGWSIRQGIYTHVFFDIIWSGSTAGGNLYLELPYKVTFSNGRPFVGVVQPSAISFGAGNTNLVINAIPNTYRGEIWTVGSGAASANLAVPAGGQISGHLMYIGIDGE